MTAGVGAGIGGSNGVDLGIGVGIGGSGTSGGGSVGGGTGGTGGIGSTGGLSNPRSPVTGGVRNPPTTGTVNPGQPGQNDRLRAELRNMSEDERLKLRRSCAMVSASPDGFDSDMQALCRLMSRISSR